MKVLSLSTVFPRPDEPRLGLFVHNRLVHLAELAEVRVLAPVAWIEAAGKGLRRPRLGAETIRREGELEVTHARWYYPPGIGGLNGHFLAWSLQAAVARIRREFRFDIIDAHFGYPEGVAAGLLARRWNCPYTVTLRGNETMHGRGGVKARLMKAALRGATGVIAVSAPLAEWAVSAGVAPGRVTVIPNGIDKRIWKPGDRAADRKELGMDDTRVHVLSAGYLIERKGHHRVVQALPALHRAGIPADLWIAGDTGREGDCREKIAKLVEDGGLNGRVHLIGGVPETALARYMGACDVFCLASEREGWPNVVNEALACGAPVVATRVGGVPEMLPREEFGVVVAPGDQEDLNAGLVKALRRQWDRERIAAWGGARGWGEVAVEVMEALRRAAGRG